MASVADLMTRVLTTVTPTNNTDEAAGAMKRGGVRHLPVVDHDGRLVGVLSQADLSNRAQHQTVSDVMTPKPVTMAPETPASESVAAMLQHGIHSLPVVDARGALVGIITSTDVLIEAYEALRQSEVEPEEGSHAPTEIENTVLRAKLERVRNAHHADMRTIALIELRRFLTRHFEREEADGGLFSELVCRRPELGADVAELCEAHARILRELEELETANHELAAAGGSKPSPGAEKLLDAITEHERLEASLSNGAH
jgi:CBS domain-containing protein